VRTAVAVIVVLAIGGGIAALLVLTRPGAQAQAREAPATPVMVLVAHPADEEARIVAFGTVIPARQVVLQPEVSGVLVNVTPALMPGGCFKESEEICRIDAREYQYAVEQQQAALVRAEFELQLEEGRQAVARQEWKLLGQEVKTTEIGKALALREPHLASAKAAVAAAQSSLKRAQLNVERCTLRAPFNAVVLSESIDVGQRVSPGAPLATLVDSDVAWVQVSLPLDQLDHLDLTCADSAGEGPAARVTQDTGRAEIVRAGRVLRLLGDLDPVGRMARALVEIQDPLRPRAREIALPMLLGAYVRVEIAGKTLAGVVRVPRTALREGSAVWVMDAQDTLAARPVEIVWRYADAVLVRGLQDGDRLVDGIVPSPVMGMRLRVAGETPPAARAEKTGLATGDAR